MVFTMGRGLMIRNLEDAPEEARRKERRREPGVKRKGGGLGILHFVPRWRPP